MQKFKTRSILINVIIIAVLAVSLITGGILIGTKYNTTNEMSNEPAKASMTNVASSQYSGYASSDRETFYARFYIYYDNTIFSSVSFSGSVTVNEGTYNVAFNWTGEITATLNSGYSWSTSRLKATYSPGYSKSSMNSARSDAYNQANSTSADCVTMTRSGNTVSIGNVAVYGVASTYNAMAVVLQDWYTVTGSIENPDTSIATVSPTSFNYQANRSGAEYIRFQGKGDGEIAGVKINGTSITINASDPGSYTAMTGCEYRCYRSDKYVYVHVQKVTRNISITATHNAINVSASLTSADSNKATLDKTSGGYFANSGTQLTFTYTSKTNYYINTIKINGNNITISETAPASFSSTTGTQYKCYRSANKVIVIVTNLTQNTTIVGTYATLWTISSLDSTLVLQSNTTQTQDNYFDTNATIVAAFTENQNVQFCIDNVWTKLQGNMGFGSVTIASGTFNYAFNIYNNFITIELTNLPKISHIAYIDYYVGPSKNITASFSGGSGSVEMYKDDSGWYNLVAMPSSTFWVDSITFNNVSVDIEYYQIEIYGVGGAESVSYTVKDSTNVFLLKFKNIYQDIAVTFNLANVKQDYKVPPTTSGGASVTGTVVTASVGGEARIVGNDIASGSDTDTVTVMAVAYSGYKFVGWVNSNDESEILSDSTSYKLSKSEANGKIIKALFVPTTTNSNTNGQTSDDLSGLV